MNQEINYPEHSEYKSPKLTLDSYEVEYLKDVFILSSKIKQKAFVNLLQNKKYGEINFLKILKDGSWDLFGNEYKIQILGSFSYVNKSWRWIWDEANNPDNFSKNTLRYALDLKEFGKRMHIDAISNSNITIEELDGEYQLVYYAAGLLDVPSMVAFNTGTTKKDAGNVVFVFERNQEITGLNDEIHKEVTMHWGSNVMEMLGRESVYKPKNEYNMVRSTMLLNGFEICEKDNILFGKKGTHEFAHLFDSHKRIANIKFRIG